jgi:sulfite exporter TauE/SafE
MALSLLISAWLVGVLGGLHCYAMCGGLLSAVGARDAAHQPLLPARTIAVRQLVYHMGRIVTYGALGAAFGASGAVALTAADFVPLQRALYLLANLLLLALGMTVALGTPGIPWLQRMGTRIFARVMRHLGPVLRTSGIGSRLALGLLWGFLPCALVYSVLPLSLFSGGAWQGAAVMIAFGLGTLPNLVAAGVFLARARRLLHGAVLRGAAGSVLIGFAMLGLWRVVYDPAALAQGAFCLVP